MNIWIARFKQFLRWFPVFSIFNIFVFFAFRFYNKFFKKSYNVVLNTKPYGFFYLRIGNSSDILLFLNIFILKEFVHLYKCKKIKTILDCGANVGMTSRWFLHHLADSEVVSIEPEKNNFDLLSKNLFFYKKRVSLILGAVWPVKRSLALCMGPGDGRNWSFGVKESSQNTDTEGYDIISLMKIRGWDQIDLLKIDIEGGESELFSRNQNKWLPFVKNMTVETHGKTAQDALFKALQDYNYDYSFSGETHFILNLSPKHI